MKQAHAQSHHATWLLPAEKAPAESRRSRGRIDHATTGTARFAIALGTLGFDQLSQASQGLAGDFDTAQSIGELLGSA